MNNLIVERYLRATFKAPGFVRGKRLLVWDSFSAHISADTKTVLRSPQLHTAVVPGGCTKWLQAPDVSWNAPFKAKLRELYDIESDTTSEADPPHAGKKMWAVDAPTNPVASESFAKTQNFNALIVTVLVDFPRFNVAV